MQKRLECRVFGRVQMVMFRDFARRNARLLGLSGAVQNMEDGSVRVVAEGEEEKLRELLARLRNGSTFSQVEKVKEKWAQPTGEFDGFEIIY